MVVVLGAGGGCERAAPAFHKVGGSEWRSIAPLGIVAKVECIGESIRRNLPVFSDPGDSVSVLVIGAEAFEEGVHDPPLWLAGDDRGVEGLGFCSVDENEIRSVAIPAASGKK